MNKKTEAFKRENLIILAALLIIFLLTFGIYLAFSSLYLIKEKNTFNSTVVRVIDGDTFEIASGEKIRLLCVDTPERNEKGYEEAKNYLSYAILNKEVILEKEISERDRYGRLLRYAYINFSHENSCISEKMQNNNILSGKICFSIGDEKFFVNKEIINNGYGKFFAYGDDKCERMN